MTTKKSPSLRRFTAISVLACMLRSSIAARSAARCAKRSNAARSAALHANAKLRRAAPQFGAAHTMLHCAAKQHIVLRSSTLLCCEAACCCAAKQHFAVLRSSTLLCCEAARSCAAKQHAARSTAGRREAPESRREAPSTLQIKLHSPCYTPLADLFSVVFAIWSHAE